MSAINYIYMSQNLKSVGFSLITQKIHCNFPNPLPTILDVTLIRICWTQILNHYLKYIME